MNNFSEFNTKFDAAMSLLPDRETRRLFMASLIGALSVYIDERTALNCMERALDHAQGFKPVQEIRRLTTAE